MQLNKLITALFLASATASALPTGDDYGYGSGTEYKRSDSALERKADLDAICARSEYASFLSHC